MGFVDYRLSTERVMLYGESTPLSGILTLPLTPIRQDLPVLVILNAGIIHKVGPNRLHVRIARDAARRGICAFRFDFAGVGDCPARGDGRSLSEGVMVDIRETIDFLRDVIGARSFVLVGLCAGADNALRAARLDERVAGVVLLDPSVHRTPKWYWYRFYNLASDPQLWKLLLTFKHPGLHRRLKKLRQFLAFGAKRPEQARRPELFRTGLGDKDVLERHFRDVIARNVQVFCAFSGGWAPVYNYRDQLFDVFPGLDFRNLLQLEHYPRAEHTFDIEEHRNLLSGDILEWFEKAFYEKPTNMGTYDVTQRSDMLENNQDNKAAIARNADRACMT